MPVNPVSVPVPDKFDVSVLKPALSVTVRVPVRVPSSVGVKVTEIPQLAPAANVCGEIGHPDVSAKSPEVEMFRIVSGTVCTFLNVTVLAALVVLTI